MTAKKYGVVIRPNTYIIVGWGITTVTATALAHNSSGVLYPSNKCT